MNFPYTLAWIFFRSLGTFYFRYRVYNVERVPTTGPFIFAANHASFVDPPLVGSTLRRDIHYLGRESLFDHPIANAVLRSVNCVPVDRDGGGATGLKTILERLLKGNAIILFPEGTRSPDGRFQPARTGIGLTVIKSTCPVVPVRIFGSFEAYGRHHTFPRPRRIEIKFARPMDFRELREEARTCSKPRLKEIYKIVTDQLMNEIARQEPYQDCERFP